MANRDPFKYCPRYCEENVWHLCQQPRWQGQEKYVLIMSNPLRACAFWEQRAVPRPGVHVFWDYHVVLVVRDGAYFVWDLDTTLSFPVAARTYLDRTFRGGRVAPDLFQPRFRIVEAGHYVAHFSSDRSHMRGRGGRWLAPPPTWPPILREGPLTFPELIDFRSGVKPETVSLAVVYSRFG